MDNYWECKHCVVLTRSDIIFKPFMIITSTNNTSPIVWSTEPLSFSLPRLMDLKNINNKKLNTSIGEKDGTKKKIYFKGIEFWNTKTNKKARVGQCSRGQEKSKKVKSDTNRSSLNFRFTKLLSDTIILFSNKVNFKRVATRPRSKVTRSRSGHKC